MLEETTTLGQQAAWLRKDRTSPRWQASVDRAAAILAPSWAGLGSDPRQEYGLRTLTLMTYLIASAQGCRAKQVAAKELADTLDRFYAPVQHARQRFDASHEQHHADLETWRQDLDAIGEAVSDADALFLTWLQDGLEAAGHDLYSGDDSEFILSFPKPTADQIQAARSGLADGGFPAALWRSLVRDPGPIDRGPHDDIPSDWQPDSRPPIFIGLGWLRQVMARVDPTSRETA